MDPRLAFFILRILRLKRVLQTVHICILSYLNVTFNLTDWEIKILKLNLKESKEKWKSHIDAIVLCHVSCNQSIFLAQLQTASLAHNLHQKTWHLSHNMDVTTLPFAAHIAVNKGITCYLVNKTCLKSVVFHVAEKKHERDSKQRRTSSGAA